MVSLGQPCEIKRELQFCGALPGCCKPTLPCVGSACSPQGCCCPEAWACWACPAHSPTPPPPARILVVFLGQGQELGLVSCAIVPASCCSSPSRGRSDPWCTTRCRLGEPVHSTLFCCCLQGACLPSEPLLASRVSALLRIQKYHVGIYPRTERKLGFLPDRRLPLSSCFLLGLPAPGFPNVWKFCDCLLENPCNRSLTSTQLLLQKNLKKGVCFINANCQTALSVYWQCGAVQ